MQRVASNRSPAVDKFGAGKNGFTAGDPQAGTPATTPGYEWFDAVQEELANLVEGLGSALDPTKRDQIKTLVLAALALKAPLASPALTGAPTAPTPAQFDSSTKLATTAFVQQALGNFQGVIVVNGNTTLTTAQAGSVIRCDGTLPYTLVLPTPVGNAGLAYVIEAWQSSSSALTLSTPAGTFSVGASSASTYALYGGGVTVVSDGANWAVIGGAGIASLGSNGYQKLPSGLILQWGNGTAGTDANGALVNFPIAFPNACLHVYASDTGAACAAYACSLVSNSQFRIYARDFNGNYSTFYGHWLAIGY